MRVICAAEEYKYRVKLIIALIIQVPIWVVTMIIVNVSNDFTVALNGFNGVPMYVWIVACFATIIQVFMG